MADADTPHVYVDLDDVLSRTITALISLLERETGRRVHEDEVTAFDLAEPFDLDAEALSSFMDRAHEQTVLGAFSPVDGAARSLSRLVELGHRVSIVTGRPPDTVETTRGWLAAHGFLHESLYFVDKYGRHDWTRGGPRPLRLPELAALDFSCAVEDSLETACWLAIELEIEVALVDRPWNRDVAALSEEAARRIVRCRSWEDVERRISELR